MNNINYKIKSNKEYKIINNIMILKLINFYQIFIINIKLLNFKLLILIYVIFYLKIRNI